MGAEAHMKFVLSMETPKTPLGISPVLRGKLWKCGIEVLAVARVAGETQLAARCYLAFSKGAALCPAILSCVALTGSCRKTNPRSRIAVL